MSESLYDFRYGKANGTYIVLHPNGPGERDKRPLRRACQGYLPRLPDALLFRRNSVLSGKAAVAHVTLKTLLFAGRKMEAQRGERRLMGSRQNALSSISSVEVAQRSDAGIERGSLLIVKVLHTVTIRGWARSPKFKSQKGSLLFFSTEQDQQWGKQPCMGGQLKTEGRLATMQVTGS
ncbi:hypothetical protein SKAU_G00375380 [Synaphobranchus kaupii]|uniref:Uncharacterized protein n=1 Tax=Synaphobranchus kaupii TaxID=118154 RepID=A0A9Q1EH16_SYNKA|nr:hypothetical protein SKAU_G00375380 [Synaphobranchus kaupii]